LCKKINKAFKVTKQPKLFSSFQLVIIIKSCFECKVLITPYYIRKCSCKSDFCKLLKKLIFLHQNRFWILKS
jgi:hypothetical protein